MSLGYQGGPSGTPSVSVRERKASRVQKDVKLEAAVTGRLGCRPGMLGDNRKPEQKERQTPLEPLEGV